MEVTMCNCVLCCPVKVQKILEKHLQNTTERVKFAEKDVVGKT